MVQNLWLRLIYGICRGQPRTYKLVLVPWLDMSMRRYLRVFQYNYHLSKVQKYSHGQKRYRKDQLLIRFGLSVQKRPVELKLHHLQENGPAAARIKRNLVTRYEPMCS